MNIEKMKKNMEIFNTFMEYQCEFLEWVEKNKNNTGAWVSYTDRWNGPEDEECFGFKKKKLPVIEFTIEYIFKDYTHPYMRILHGNNEVFRMTLKENRMDCEIKDIHDIEGI